jgi:hypothetical protein
MNRKPLRRLPLNIRESEDVTELFGNQHLLTFPLLMNSISHVITTRMRDNKVHFGLRRKSVIIRALIKNSFLEYVPWRVFTDNSNFDLLLGLIKNCVH